MRKSVIAALLAHALFLPALSALPAAAQTANDRVLTIFGSDPCPADTICVRAPESERFRIPKSLRNSGVIPPANQSWAARAAQVDTIERSGPSQCTPSGPGGWSGCYAAQMRALKAERDAARRAATPDLDK